MGLDMFLYKIQRKEVAYWRKANMIHAWFERKLTENDCGLENCHDYYVPKEYLIELRDLCQKILDNAVMVTTKIKNGEHLNNKTGKWEPIYETGEAISNPELAQELLPTEQGFFFSSQEYDKYYIEDLESTVEQINKILETTDFDNEEIVYSAWW